MADWRRQRLISLFISAQFIFETGKDKSFSSLTFNTSIIRHEKSASFVFRCVALE